MSKIISAFWCNSLNFGDALNPWLIKKLSGQEPCFVDSTFGAEHFVCCGSILNHANEHAFVWGAGIATITDGINSAMNIRAVRGPLSRARALACGADCPPVYGDPALVLPRIYKPTEMNKFDVGIVPHYIDQYRAFTRYPEHNVINVFDPVEQFIDKIAACEYVVSSSLHGIIVAHAYGIPAVWVQFSDSVGGDGTKFRDYYMSVGMDVPRPVDLRERVALPSKKHASIPDKINTDDLWGACPLRA